MPKLRVSLSIGYPGASHKDVIDIHQEAWDACENDDEREKLIDEIVMEWAWNYIDVGAEIVEV